jgi:hypothetical protein
MRGRGSVGHNKQQRTREGHHRGRCRLRFMRHAFAALSIPSRCMLVASALPACGLQLRLLRNGGCLLLHTDCGPPPSLPRVCSLPSLFLLPLSPVPCLHASVRPGPPSCNTGQSARDPPNQEKRRPIRVHREKHKDTHNEGTHRGNTTESAINQMGTSVGQGPLNNCATSAPRFRRCICTRPALDQCPALLVALCSLRCLPSDLPRVAAALTCL